MPEEKVYDCIIIGAGPGGLQAAIYLGRYNMDVLLIDRTGGRTYHARAVENFLTQKAISGKEIIEIGLEQARSFNVQIDKARVTKILKGEYFEVYTGKNKFLAELPLKKDSHDFKYVVNHNFESSLNGLYIVGPVNTGNDQVVIAAGEGAVAAIDIKKRLLNL